MKAIFRLRRGDYWLIGLVLLLAVGLLAGRALWGRAGGTAVVTTPTESFTLPLSQNTTLTLTGRDGLTVTVQVDGGAVFFAESACPDRLCVHSGRLSRAGACAACVPAGVTLRVEGAGAEVDAIAE